VPRLAVVTGASSGIGRATALHLASRGWRVIAGVRAPAAAERLAAEGGDLVTPVALDVTDPATIETAAELVRAEADGGLDALVNNAGVAVGGPLEAVPLEDLRRQLDVNVVGQVAVTQALLPLLREARGRIVFVSSIGGRLSNPYVAPYSASKFAVEAIADALRVELHAFGIRVALIEPGAVDTPIWDKGQAEADTVEDRIPAHLRELYAPGIAAVRRFARESPERAVSPDAVAASIEHALTADRPRTRYVVGRDARVQAALKRVLPDRALDAALRRLMRV
jgi:NAD(P)-dependent dehydrogenase (short-subunit alcohol dehydrogenase family)